MKAGVLSQNQRTRVSADLVVAVGKVDDDPGRGKNYTGFGSFNDLRNWHRVELRRLPGEALLAALRENA